MVPVDSRRVSRAPRYSGTRVRVQSTFVYVVITLYDRPFQDVRLVAGLVTLWFYTDTRPTTPSPPQNSDMWPVTCGWQKILAHHTSHFTFHSFVEDWVWAIPRSLAATSGITVVFFSSRY